MYSPGDDLEKLASAARELIPRKLTPLLEAMLGADPAMFEKTYAGQAALQLALIGEEHNSPKVVVVEFQAEEIAADAIALTARTMRCPGDCPASTTFYLLGAHEAMDQSVRSHADAIVHDGQAGTERLLGLEYSSRPDLVGGPVSTLKVGRSGGALLRNGVCALN